MSDLYYDPTDTERWDAAVEAYSGSDDEVNDALEWLAEVIGKPTDEVPFDIRCSAMWWFSNSPAWDDAVRRTMP